MARLRRLAEVAPSGVDKKEREDDPDVHLCSYTHVYYNDFIDGDLDFEPSTADESDIERFALREGDIIATKDSESWDDIGVPALVTEDLPNVVCAYHLFVVRTQNPEIIPAFLFWSFKSRFVAHQLEGAATGVTRYGLTTGDLADARLPLPPKATQRRIASFLDHHTARIDQLVEKKQRLLELLEEKRQAVITQAVTKGLDKSVELRQPEEDLLPSIPKHWSTAPLKFTTKGVTVGIVHKPSEQYVDEGVPALRSLNVKPGAIREEELVYISEEANQELDGSQIHAGDLVAVRSGDPGTTAVIPERLDGINCIDLLIIRQPTRYRSEFLCYLMNSEMVQRQFHLGTEGAAQQHFNVEDASNLLLPIPPEEEQLKIEKRLDEETQRLDELKERTLDGICLLQEKRHAIITAAVTGQIDVSDWEPPEDTDRPTTQTPEAEAVEA